MEFELYHHQTWGLMWIPFPDQHASGKNVETPSVFQTSFLEAMLGELGKLSCHVWKLATEPSTPHSADGSSAADKAPGGFSEAVL